MTAKSGLLFFSKVFEGLMRKQQVQVFRVLNRRLQIHKKLNKISQIIKRNNTKYALSLICMNDKRLKTLNKVFIKLSRKYDYISINETFKMLKVPLPNLNWSEAFQRTEGKHTWTFETTREVEIDELESTYFHTKYDLLLISYSRLTTHKSSFEGRHDRMKSITYFQRLDYFSKDYEDTVKQPNKYKIANLNPHNKTFDRHMDNYQKYENSATERMVKSRKIESILSEKEPKRRLKSKCEYCVSNFI